MQTPKIINYFLSLSFVLSNVIACNVTTGEVPKYIPDVKGAEQTVEIVRFEQDFFRLDTNDLAIEIAELKQKYPDFTEIFLRGTLRIPDPAYDVPAIKGYLRHKPARATLARVQASTKDLSTIQVQLNELATYFEYYNYDNKPSITKAYTHMAEYAYDRAVGDGCVPLPLDMTLGAGYPAYTQAQIPMYQQRTLNQDHLVAKAAYAIAEDMVATNCEMQSSFMIDFILLEGKKFYITDILLPNVTDSIKYGFSERQMKYCKDGELELYKHMTEEEILYSEDVKKYSKFITPGPFNPQIALPGNSGSWLGAQIITSYANHHRQQLKQANPDAKAVDRQILQMVLKEKNPQKFLQLYKPRK